jgi:hypothetical protein
LASNVRLCGKTINLSIIGRLTGSRFVALLQCTPSTMHRILIAKTLLCNSCSLSKTITSDLHPQQ